MMNFKAVAPILGLLILSCFPSVYANTSLPTGEYRIDLIVLDSDEKYPVSIQFNAFTRQDLKNDVSNFTINYSSYGCKAIDGTISYENASIKIQEKVTVGKDSCEASHYFIFPQQNTDNKKPFFKKIINVTEGENIQTILSEVSFNPDAYTQFLLNNDFTDFNQIIESTDYPLIDRFIKATSQNSPYFPKALQSLENTTIRSKKISFHERFLANYQDSGQKIEYSLIKLYQDQKNPESYYRAYKLSNNPEDLQQALYLANAKENLDGFIQQHPELKNIPNLSAIKLKLYRNEESSNGYLKAFAISQKHQDIQQAFKKATDEKEVKNAEQQLELFLYPGTDYSTLCLSGQISPSKKTQYPELMGMCDTPDRDLRALGLCLAIAGGGCDILTAKIENPILQKFPKSLCRKAIAKVTSGTSELADFDIFHAIDVLAYTRKQTLSSENSLIKLFLGAPLAITEVAGRLGALGLCKARLRSKCAILYEVCR